MDISIENSQKIALLNQDAKNIKALLSEIKGDIREVKNILNNGYVRKAEYEYLQKRVSNIEGNLTWAIRIILGVIITSLLSLILLVR